MPERININLNDCGECTVDSCRVKHFAKWLKDPERDLPYDFENLDKDIRAFVGHFGLGGSVKTEGNTITIDANNPCKSIIVITTQEHSS